MAIKKINNNFETMSKGDAVLYCYKHEQEFKTNATALGENADNKFDFIVDGIENEYIKPNELPDYGMNFN